MQAIRDLSVRFCCVILSAVALLVAGSAGAQAPTPEQLDMLRNLSQEQRDALMQQFGIQPGSVGDTGTGSTNRQGTQRSRDGVPGQSPSDTTGDQQRNDLRRLEPQEDQEEYRNGVPLLRADDSIILRIDFPRPQTAGANIPGGTQAQGGQQVPGTGANTVAPAPVMDPNAPMRPPSVTSSAQPLTRQRATELSQEEKERRQKLIDLIRARNPYRLTSEGVLLLPGFQGIPLAGLTEFEATVRLQSDPELRGFDVALIRLPLKKIGVDALKPFGYDLFARAPSTFAPVTNVPVPADYVVGPGDRLEIQLYGSQNRTVQLEVGRDGRINFPELGPISVAGQRFNSVKESIEGRVSRQMIGVQANVTMGDTRSIRVFVLGEARQSGSFTISGLGTMTSALFAAGGVKRIGSLRNIQLKRQGQVIRTLDLYDMLIRGDTTDDARLLPGDVVFIPPVGPTVSVSGEVHRPAIYEVRKDSTTADVIDLAGGLTPQADATRIALTRIDEKQGRIALNVEVGGTGAAAAGPGVRNGDVLRVARLRPTLDSGVTVDGFVFAPGTFAYRQGLRLSEVIRSVDDLQPNADIHYLLIRREQPTNRQVTVLSADLGAALANPGSEADVILMPRDRVTVFDLEPGRDRIIRPVMNELRLQSSLSSPTEVVSVEGKVKVPGEYPLEPGMTVSDLIRAGGGLGDSAYSGKAELTRYRVISGDARRTEVINVDLAAIVRGDTTANITLQPFDSLSIKETPDWGEQQNVTLVGEFRFPGRYSIKRGETLKSVIARAGGLTDFAFPQGSVFTREDLREREQKQLDMLADRVQNDLATLALQGAAANQAQAGTALTVGQSLLTQLKASPAVGRLVIDLPRTMRADLGGGGDIILRDGDRLVVPKQQQEVTVIGEVQTTTSHLYRPELARDDYIALSGGVTRRADKAKIYVVRADGSVVANEGGRWFSRSGVDIKPGDTVVVPLDTERLPALPFWQAVTQIIYNLAISAAAVNSF
jgi:protein involved in polysaccharide export with SLBB domain